VKELYVSAKYVVFPDGLRTMDGNGPYVSLIFDATKIKAGQLRVSRNGKEILRQELKPGHPVQAAFEEVKPENDVVTWDVTDGSGAVVEKGTLGFPMGGAIPKLILYEVEPKQS
jgi:hypothetical protein